MNYSDLTTNQKRWYHALYDELGGDTSPDAIALLYPSNATSYYVCGTITPNATGEYVYGGNGRPHPESPTWSLIPFEIPAFDYWQLNDTYYLALITMPAIESSTAVIFDFNEANELCHQWGIGSATSLVGTYEPLAGEGVTEGCDTSGVATVSLTPCN